MQPTDTGHWYGIPWRIPCVSYSNSQGFKNMLAHPMAVCNFNHKYCSLLHSTSHIIFLYESFQEFIKLNSLFRHFKVRAKILATYWRASWKTSNTPPNTTKAFGNQAIQFKGTSVAPVAKGLGAEGGRQRALKWETVDFKNLPMKWWSSVKDNKNKKHSYCLSATFGPISPPQCHFHST